MAPLGPCFRNSVIWVVVFQPSRKWNKHGQCVYASSNRKFHQFLTWSDNRQLHTGFRCSLFYNSYVLPSMLYGCQFLSAGTIAFFDKKLRSPPSDAFCNGPPPGAAGLGELGWAPFRHEVLKNQFSLFGRLSSASPAGTRRGLAARVFRNALGQQASWALITMRDCVVQAPHMWGVSPGCSGSTVSAWRRRCMRPALDRHAAVARRAEVAAVPWLSLFAVCHPRLGKFLSISPLLSCVHRHCL